MQPGTLRVPTADAERPLRHSHAERGNDHFSRYRSFCRHIPGKGRAAPQTQKAPTRKSRGFLLAKQFAWNVLAPPVGARLAREGNYAVCLTYLVSVHRWQARL